MSVDSREAEYVLAQHNRAMMERLAEKMDKIQESLGDVRERLTRMEASTVQHSVEDLKKENSMVWERITALEADKNARAGAVKASEWFWRLGPWIFAIAWVVISNLRSVG